MDKFYDIVESICFSVLLVTVVILFFCRVIVVDGDSMNNTLNNGEKVLITNFMTNIDNGDIVVTDGRIYNGKPLIKRVIAKEGDTIKIDYKTGDVYLNGILLQETYIREKINIDNSKEDLEMTIPDGMLFIMGDNRNFSLDSRRAEIGIVSKKDILGKTVIRISPASRIGKVN